jgi:subtilisin family serine protease
VAGVAPAAAGPPPPLPPSTAAPGQAANVATVTLITGDVVRLTTYRDGRQAASVQLGRASGHGTFQTMRHKGHTLVIPEVALPYLRSGLLDKRLFDVTELVAQQYDDDRARSLPLILEYATDPANAARTRSLLAQPVPAQANRTRVLPSVGGVAVAVPRAGLAQFWEAIDDDRAAAATKPVLDRQLRKVWLDGRVKAALDASVPKIGAPAAWQAGVDGTGVKVAVVDTGIDATHPDLAGRVVESVNFSSAPDATDRYGHGTHVASTVAGSGAASGGKYKGAAPGAQLLNVKVLNDHGSGSSSAVMAGLEWAAARAKVVNVSLGENPTDGTDPMSKAVNRLSAAHGTLFVIAAGNSGEDSGTVATPGAADAALTVGATTKTDELAEFSSRGPRVGDRSVKPEIVAPGVDIVAARAAGTGGAAADGHYTELSGTSMATPHVSGAAAIVAQQHPTWSGEQIKALLTSTATTLAGGTVYEQGAGRVDLARAVGQQRLTASTGSLSMGRFTGPYGDVDQVHKKVTYRNDGDADLTLDLAVSAKNASGAAAGSGMLNISPSTLTVPAHGTAEATVTLDPDTGELGLYSGRLVATARDGKTVLAAAVGFEKELLHTLTIRAIARDGRPSPRGSAHLWNLDTSAIESVYPRGAPAKAQVRPGQYSLFGLVSTMDEPGRAEIDLTAMANPQLTVSGDAEIVLDARGAKPVNIRTPKPTDWVSARHTLYREINGEALMVSSGAWEKLSVVPSPPAGRGQLEYMANTDLQKPVLTMRIAGADVVLHPRYLTPSWDSRQRLDGRRRLPAVFVGAGRPADFVGRDVRGKVALVRSTPGLEIEDQVAAAVAAKAAMVVVLASEPGLFEPYVDPAVPLPTVGLAQAEGVDLLRRLGQGKVMLQLEGTPHSPYRYSAALPSKQVPDGIDHAMDATNTALQHTKVYAVRPNQLGWYTDHVWRPYTWISVAQQYVRPFPFQQERYFSANDTLYSQSFHATPGSVDEMVSLREQFRPGAERTKTWFKGPLRPGTSTSRPISSRTKDQFLITFDSFVDAEPDHANAQQGAKTAARVYRGELVAEGRHGLGYFDVGVAQPATYRVELDVAEGRPGWSLSPEAYSAWTFSSTRPTGPGAEPLPVLAANWDLDLDLNNAAPAGRAFALRLNAATQPGAQPVPVKAAKVWVSFNDGGTWKRVAVAGTGGAFTGSVWHPKLPNTTGFVSLRYEITDTAGGKLEQTVIRAYALK